MEESDQAAINLGAVGGGLFAVSADEAPSFGGEVDGGCTFEGGAATDAGEEFGEVAALAEEVELEGEESLLAAGSGQFGDCALETIEQIGMRIVFFDQAGDQFSRVKAQINATQVLAKGKMAFAQAPFGQWGQVFHQIVHEDGFTDIEQIQPSIKLACTGFGAAMRALSNQARDSVLAGEECDDLGGLAELNLAEADTSIANQGHGMISW